MKVVDIPYFKEVVIMSTVCDSCGYKSNEVKAGGAIADKGKRIKLKVTDVEDLSRDILKSESCGLEVPELDLALEPGTLGGKFTTVEGLLQNVYDELDSKVPFTKGDSVSEEKRRRLDGFLAKLAKAIKVEVPYTLILDDPLGNSYLQNLYAPDPDPNMTVELYDRSWEQNEFLGLNDMKTD
jgi:zinc finger protein